MTTIVYRAGVMAADSRVGHGELIYEDAYPKLYRLDDGAVAGFACQLYQVRAWIDWYHRGREPGALPQAFTDYCNVLVAYPDGPVDEYQGSYVAPRVEREMYTIGSGWHAARAAMLMGATAAQAVEVAKMVDKNSGGDVQIMRVTE